MSRQVYQELLSVMQSRRGAYAGMDIPEFYALVEELFTPEEAVVNNALPRKPETASQIADRMNRDEKEMKDLLKNIFILELNKVRTWYTEQIIVENLEKNMKVSK